MVDTVRMTGALEPRDAWVADACSMAATLDVVSTRTTFLLLREAFYGATRFDEFVVRVGASEPVVAARLRDLVDHGLLERVPYRDPGQRTRTGYALTERGADLFPTLVALMRWGDRWIHGGRGPVELLHRECGAPVDVEIRCANGHPVDMGDLDLAASRRTTRR